MIATSGPAPAPAYAAGARSRRATAVLAVLALHAAPALLMLNGVGLSGARGRGGAESGEALVLMDVASIREEAPAQEASKAAPPPVGRESAEADEAKPVPAHAGIDGDTGTTLFEQQLAQAISDDPSAGGGALDYAIILRRHLEEHGRNLREQARLRGSRLATLRVRIDREGRVLDARVLRAAGAETGELALATLWRADPLPAVPATLPAPLEVDVPMRVRLPG
ncbi:TonB family protein [Sandaracinobacter sp. RS1-74]|uniref:energy transducer TonB family protein n=1 Tax=Sandaracinobacteroides sayramensis TaxID=2913411 RepID=UPI001EDBF0D5|nr:energy transducer TonB [Sandaracinobacteroides sayramensis]MCG2839434.1 TonB family protein [Sandaracinobacteroides sayramensis]